MSTKDDFGVKPAPSTQTSAEMALELEALRKQVAHLSAKPVETGVSYAGDVNESPAGEDADGNAMFWYRIDLPPIGGTDIKLCGVAYYHGQQYKVDVNQLRTMKEIVSRTWAHEKAIAGSANDNAYRRMNGVAFNSGKRVF